MPLNKKNAIAHIKASINKKTVNVFLSIIDFFLVLTIVVLFYVTIPLSSTKVIFIPKGTTTSILSYLNKKGYELNALDKTIIRFLGYPQSGWIDLRSNYMSKGDFLYKLTTSKAALKSITLIPGETSYFFLQTLAQKFNLSEKKLTEIYNQHAFKSDGNILAETYNLPLGMTEEHLLFYLFSYTNKKYEAYSKKIFGEYQKKNWYKYIVIASIIQKEAANVKEMPVVSSVIYNRLKKKMALQMDGTLNYGPYSHTKVTAKMIRQNESSYNTYKNKSLPLNPICAVSLSAIKAAVFPANTNYLYFVKNEKTKLHTFSSNYKTHVNNINKNRLIKKQQKRIKKRKPQTVIKQVQKKNTQKKLTHKESSVFPAKNNTSKRIKSLWKNVN